MKYRDRYGALNVGGKIRKVHRVAWEAFRGAIPSGLCVLHRCDNPACFNPDHLFLGTQQENIADMHAKGRNRPGICQGEKRSARLRNIDIHFMRYLAAKGVVQRRIAEMYRISFQHCNDIIQRQRWAHI